MGRYNPELVVLLCPSLHVFSEPLSVLVKPLEEVVIIVTRNYTNTYRNSSTVC